MANNDLFKGLNRKGTSCYKWDLSKEKVNIDKDKLLPFWIADSDYETCPEVKQALINRASHGAYGYSYASEEYFNALNKWTTNHYGYSCGKDNVVLTAGVVNALYFIVQLFTNVNDKVLVNPPVYNPFYNVINSNNREVVYSKLIREEINDYQFTYKFDFLDLEEKIKNSKMYILCNPHNPVGRCYTKEELKKIVDLCKKYNCLLVSDEIHCDLIMDGFKFTSVGNFFKDYDNIIICTAPSKTFNVAGLADSNIVLNNKEMYKAYHKQFEDMSINNNIFGLTATTSAYENGAYWVKEQNSFLSSNAKLVYEFSRKNKIKVCLLEGTYLMWLDLSRLNLKQEDILNGLFKKNIWVNSGTTYDSDAVGYIRLNIACSKEQLVEGLKLIEEFIKENE